MRPQDRACFNCGYSELYKVPLVNATVEQDGVGMHLAESNYWGLCLCDSKTSDHRGHYVSLRHVCDYHSDVCDKDGYTDPHPDRIRDLEVKA